MARFHRDACDKLSCAVDGHIPTLGKALAVARTRGLLTWKTLGKLRRYDAACVVARHLPSAYVDDVLDELVVQWDGVACSTACGADTWAMRGTSLVM